jgi:hypothetical protein
MVKQKTVGAAHLFSTLHVETAENTFSMSVLPSIKWPNIITVLKI